jgi:hypothetical protein
VNGNGWDNTTNLKEDIWDVRKKKREPRSAEDVFGNTHQ